MLMDTIFVSRTYLETLSTADLIALADEYGIDIPEHLNRRFIIGELLEVVEEFNDEKKENESLQEIDSVPEGIELPLSYNETCVTAIMRNPAWCYVYWDISAADKDLISQVKGFVSILLRVSFYHADNLEKAIDSFDIKVSNDDREQYVLLPSSENFVRVDLCVEAKNQEIKHLAKSSTLKIPKGFPEISSASLEKSVSPIMELSGMQDLIRNHYKNHRQSFS